MKFLTLCAVLLLVGCHSKKQNVELVTPAERTSEVTTAPELTEDSNLPKFLGVFSNIQSEDNGEHCAGWRAEIWLAGSVGLGLIEHAEGLCGDFPAAAVQGVEFGTDGSVHFTAIIGPTCKKLSFAGLLTPAELRGSLAFENKIHELTLPRVEPKTAPAVSLAELQETLRQILEFRGYGCAPWSPIYEDES